MPLHLLNDGIQICVRPIRADDGERLRASHARLSPESRYRRFLAAKPQLSIADARYLVEIDGSDHFALVATTDEEDLATTDHDDLATTDHDDLATTDHGDLTTTDDDDDHEAIVAVARFVRIPNVPDAAEFAIVVGDSYQGQGLATELLSRLARAAAERGIARFRATMLADNVPMRRLFARVAAGDMRERRMGSISEVEIDLPRDGKARLSAAPAMIAGCAGS